MASYASLGDVIIAEPKSMIGFAGPRVIKETTHQDLPKGFQTAEFLEEHGLIDQIVHRKNLRPQIAEFLRFLGPAAVNYREALAWLYATQRFGIELGWKTSAIVSDALGLAGQLCSRSLQVGSR